MWCSSQSHTSNTNTFNNAEVRPVRWRSVRSQQIVKRIIVVNSPDTCLSSCVSRLLPWLLLLLLLLLPHLDVSPCTTPRTFQHHRLLKTEKNGCWHQFRVDVTVKVRNSISKIFTFKYSTRRNEKLIWWMLFASPPPLSFRSFTYFLSLFPPLPTPSKWPLKFSWYFGQHQGRMTLARSLGSQYTKMRLKKCKNRNNVTVSECTVWRGILRLVNTWLLFYILFQRVF